MKNSLLILLGAVVFLVSCRSAKKIQTAIAKKDSAEAIVVTVDKARADSLQFINEAYNKVIALKIDFKTFSAKINADYIDGSENSYNVTANIRMYKDSVIWISVNTIFGIEALRVLITKQSVKILDKQNKTYTEKSLSYLQNVTTLPLDLAILQNLIIGNPIFFSDQIISYSKSGNLISLLSNGDRYRNLLTLNESDFLLQRSKLNDVDLLRNRTYDLSYSNYENKKGVNFSTKRSIYVVEKTKSDIKLDYEQYDFNEELTFPFSIPGNYKTL